MEAGLIKRFIAIVGDKNAMTGAEDLQHYTHENRGLFVGNTPLVLKPGSTEEVSAIMRLATETKTPVIPQGGHTGHVGGAVTDETGTQIVVSLGRMNTVREVDLEGNVIVCEAGCVLATLQDLAAKNDRYFPLALGSQGSCQIGGNISTNAGGTAVLAFGNTRQLVMGLEVVLPSGEIWNGLRRLKKDNTGYDLKDLFIGAEGTLGIVTAAVLKLFPKPRGSAVSICALESVEQAISLFKHAEEIAGLSLTAFEFMSSASVSATAQHIESVRNPLNGNHPWFVLMQIHSNRSQEDAETQMEAILTSAAEKQMVLDAAIAQSLQQQAEFWHLRESMPLAQKALGGSMKHDISIPLKQIPAFLQTAGEIIRSKLPGAILYTFGHLGDGNIHYNISQPPEEESEVFLARQPEINDIIHDLVVEMNGSVAAEHGVGKLKLELLARTKDPVELELMRTIKKSIDPLGIMNPGKVVNTK